MNQGQIIDFTRETILLTIEISMPVMLVGLVVGVIISLIQALTQVQEMTLTFVPKIIAIFATMFLLFPVMITLLTEFMDKIANQIIHIG